MQSTEKKNNRNQFIKIKCEKKIEIGNSDRERVSKKENARHTSIKGKYGK